ncbi:hypothetical protein H2200_000059 [Cladophialophora chaetospira]|uniref:Uncharacterized protein n=1 Tax=Cladophialophora chaetospira TaxID=386627 RepID=A0AA38XNK7_9EURO|nr:hypothetical protein H2200_000059 [Cladophialophora chaetospira]
MWPFNSARPVEVDEVNTAAPSLPDSPVQPLLGEPIPAVKEQDTLVKFSGWPNERLSIPLVLRAPTLMLASFACGFSLGASQGATKGAYRYRAENAHRLPTTQTGWFLYQKSKNYHAMLGGVKEGAKFGSVCTVWATLFMVTEEMVDLSRARLFARGDDDVATGQRDFGSTVIAGMTVAGIYSWKRGLDHFAAAGIARSALRLSFAYGVVQDLTATIRGNPPAYISWIKRKISG